MNVLKFSVLIFAFLFLATVTLAAVESLRSPTDYFSEQDAKAVVDLIESQKSNDGSYGSLENTFYAVNLSINPRFSRLSKNLVDASLTCQYAKRFLSTRESAEHLYYVVSIIESLGCGSEVGKDIRTALENALSSGRLSGQYYAVSAIRRLQQEGHIQFDDAEWSTVVKSLASLQESDGRFKSDSDAKKGSALNSGYVYQILAQLPATTEDEEVITDLTESVDMLFTTALEEQDSDDGIIFFTADSSLDNLKSTALVFSGITTLAEASGSTIKSTVTNEAVLGIAEYSARVAKHPSNLKDAYYGVLLLETVNNNAWYVPLVVTLPTTSVFLAAAANADNNPRIRVTNIFGEYAGDVKVVVDKVYLTENEKEVLSVAKTVSADGKDRTAFVFDLLAGKPEPGYYSLDLTVTPQAAAGTKSRYTAVKDTRNLKVVSNIEIVDIEVTVSETKDVRSSKDRKALKISATYPNAISKELNLNATGSSSQPVVIVAFAVKNAVSQKPVKVHQAFVSVSNDESGNVFVAKQKKSGRYEAKIVVSGDNSTFSKSGSVSGKYAVKLFIGDSFVANPISYQLATANIDFGVQEEDIYNPAPARRNRTARRGALPEINHIFRKSEKRPNPATSMLFTGLCLAPLGVLLIGIMRVGGNLSNMPTGTGAIYSLGFFASFGAILGLFVVYWFALNVVQALGYLAVLGIPTVLFGLKTLQAVHANRVSHSE